MRRIIEKLLIGKRVIMFRSGHTGSGKYGHVCIGIITSVIKDEKFMRYSIGIDQYGYDVKEDDYALNAYVWGGYSLQETISIFMAQPLLKKQFKGVNVKLHEDSFYESAKLITQTLTNPQH